MIDAINNLDLGYERVDRLSDEEALEIAKASADFLYRYKEGYDE